MRYEELLFCRWQRRFLRHARSTTEISLLLLLIEHDGEIAVATCKIIILRIAFKGIGDFSVMLDQQQKFLYFFFSNYPRDLSEQGVAEEEVEKFLLLIEHD